MVKFYFRFCRITDKRANASSAITLANSMDYRRSLTTFENTEKGEEPYNHTVETSKDRRKEENHEEGTEKKRDRAREQNEKWR